MAERTTITQVTNIGVEVTPGTQVTAARRLQALSIDPSVSTEVDMFRPAGQKFHSLQSLNQEWVEADLSGRATYTELIYPLSSVLGTGDVDTDTGVSVWAFSPNNSEDDDPVTFTVEKGSGVRAHRFGYGLVTGLDLSFSRSSIEVGGSMLGRRVTDGVTMNASPTALDLIPVLPTQTSVFLDDTAAGLGTTKLTRVVSVDYSFGDRFGPAWFLDAAEPSFTTHVETEPTFTATLTVEADAQGMGLLADLRTGDSTFLRTEALGPVIGATATPHRLTIDMAAKVEDVGDWSDTDGIYTIEYTLRAVYDPTWAQAIAVEVANGLATL